jgi:serine/threonine-protein kinase
VSESSEQTPDAPEPGPQVDQPTMIHGPGMTDLDQLLIDAAVDQGKLTKGQAEELCDSFANLAIGSDVIGESQGPGAGQSATATLSAMATQAGIDLPDLDDLLEDVGDDFVPGYRIERELGRGAMGVVYRAIQTKLDRPVALKVITPQLSRDKNYVVRFKREALTLAKLNHPNIVQVYDYGESDGRVYLALELVHGEDASLILKREGSLPEQQVLGIVRDAALGLSHAHQHGVVHRDIKPANLMVVAKSADATGGSVTKVMDLGLAREVETKAGQAELTQAGMILGSPAYMAPEQTEGKPADHLADIYALGATLYHLATGSIPYSSSSVVNVLVKKRTERLPNPCTLVPKLSDGVVRILDRMLARPKEQRYQDYAELIADLDAVIAGGGPGSDAVPREHSSLDLSGRLAEASGAELQTRELPAKADDPATPHAPPAGQDAEEPAAGGAAPLLALLAVFVAFGLYAVYRAQAGDPGGGGSSGLVEGAEAPAVAALETYEALQPDGVMRQADELIALAEQVEALPPEARAAAEVRLDALVRGALDATSEACAAELSALHQAGDYARLDAKVRRVSGLHALVEREVPADVQELGAKAGAALKDGAGEAERKAWAAAQKAQAADDPVAVLRALDEFDDRFGSFSPVVAEAAALAAEAEAQAPRVELTLSPAEAIFAVDGQVIELESPGRWQARLLAGTHRLEARLDGHLPLVYDLDLRDAARLDLVLGPAGSGRIPSPTIQRPLWRGANKFFEDWSQSGSWKPVGEQAGMEGEADAGETGGDDASVRRDLARLLASRAFRAAKGWSLSYQAVLHADPKGEPGADEAQRAAAEWEACLLPGPDGRWAVLGVRGGALVAGVRDAQGLTVRARRALKAHPEVFRADYDGKVLTLYADDSPMWSLAPEWEVEAPAVEFTVGSGRVLFRNLLLSGLVDPE